MSEVVTAEAFDIAAMDDRRMRGSDYPGEVTMMKLPRPPGTVPIKPEPYIGAGISTRGTEPVIVTVSSLDC